MATSVVQVRVDTALKEQAAKIFEDLGIDLSTAIRMFLKRSVLDEGIPFRMTRPRTNYEYGANRGLWAMRELQKHAEENGLSDMTLEEINAEIDAVRRGEA
jgi:DNA-damage-inducible protein J